MEPSTDYDKSLALIRSAQLSHWDRSLLTVFLERAKDRQRAASHLLTTCEPKSGSPDARLAGFLTDWKLLISKFTCGRDTVSVHASTIRAITSRDPRCFLTGHRGSPFDPLMISQVFPSLQGRVDEHLLPTLDAFLSRSHVDWIQLFAANVEDRRHSASNLWRIRASAADAFSKGMFRVDVRAGARTYVTTTFIGRSAVPSIVDSVPDIRKVNEQESNVDRPDPVALEILSRFADPIRWTCITKQVPSETQSPPPSRTGWGSIPGLSSCLSLASRALLGLWLVFPAFLRAATYRGLAKIGRRMYGSTSSFKVQRLPFGLYLKVSPCDWQRSLENEQSALSLVRQKTSVPVPKPLDLAISRGDCYSLTTRCPGVPVGLAMDLLNDDQVRVFAQDLQRCLAKLRTITRDPSDRGRITDSNGGPCHDHRIISASSENTDYFGPFDTEQEFNTHLRSVHLPDLIHRSDHDIVFTHGDINMRNILVGERTGRLTGIVDWETAGWYPEYWEYTKAVFATKFIWRWLSMVVDPTFKQLGDYEQELEVEKKLWQHCW